FPKKGSRPYEEGLLTYANSTGDQRATLFWGDAPDRPRRQGVPWIGKRGPQWEQKKMKYMVDLVILTDSRYVAPKKTGAYVENVLLEDRLVQEALNAEGLRVARRSWDDPDFDWSTTRYALFRSTWDYFERFGEFSDWFEKAAQQTQFINSGDLIRWNMDKHYLQSLSRAGINVPGTLFVEKGSATTLADAHGLAIRQKGFQNPEFVLKPCVSGGGGHTYRIALAEIPQREALFAELIASEAMMLQEFQEN